MQGRRVVRRICLCAAALALYGGSWLGLVRPAQAQPVERVVQGQPWLARAGFVVDGDSLWVQPEGGGRRARLRLQGIDAPERCQPGGAPARAALQALVQGERLHVTVHARDRFGRRLASVRRQRDGLDVAAGPGLGLERPPGLAPRPLLARGGAGPRGPARRVRHRRCRIAGGVPAPPRAVRHRAVWGRIDTETTIKTIAVRAYPTGGAALMDARQRRPASRRELQGRAQRLGL